MMPQLRVHQHIWSVTLYDLLDEAADQLKALVLSWVTAAGQHFRSMGFKVRILRINGLLTYIHIRGVLHKGEEVANTDEYDDAKRTATYRPLLGIRWS